MPKIPIKKMKRPSLSEMRAHPLESLQREYAGSVDAEWVAHIERRMEMARCFERDHLWVQAERVYNAIAEELPDDETVAEHLIYVAAQTGNWIPAYEALSRFLEQTPKNHLTSERVFQCARIAAEKLKRHSDAIELIDRYFDMFICHPHSAKWLVQNASNWGKSDVIINIVTRHATNVKDETLQEIAFNALGFLFQHLKHEKKEAGYWYRKTLTISPGNSDAIDGLLSLYD
ncbi:MAG: hypothetical protein JXX29_03195 [Deltaproteobacteria bacterium]|nr:hypothetical protein [Deltaproteobacteria bacterium]MBN2670647.1 hypothetical protein [Deltaproteobacteria bacterium]